MCVIVVVLFIGHLLVECFGMKMSIINAHQNDRRWQVEQQKVNITTTKSKHSNNNNSRNKVVDAKQTNKKYNKKAIKVNIL